MSIRPASCSCSRKAGVNFRARHIAVSPSARTSRQTVVIDAVRDYVDSVTGDSSQNTYFELDTQVRWGPPEAASTSAQ